VNFNRLSLRADYRLVMDIPPIDLALMRIPTRLNRRLVLLLVCLAAVSACVFRIDVQQGNLLEDDDIDAVQMGMTRSQITFVLGTPMVEDAFHHDRWDYIYYFRKGRSKVADRRWVIVYFDGDRVRDIQKDVPLNPT
jgi:outer membrane protein assembly factor BamE